MSKLDSSNTMTMCGGFLYGGLAAGWQASSPAAGRKRPTVCPAASNIPRSRYSEIALAAERVKFETYSPVVKSLWGSFGATTARPASAARQPATPTAPLNRLTRKASYHQIATNNGTVTTTNPATVQARLGNTVSRKAKV